MASLTRWTWVCINSGSLWWTGRSGVLRLMGSQKLGHDWVTELNWTFKLVSPDFGENPSSYWECCLHRQAFLHEDLLPLFSKSDIDSLLKRHLCTLANSWQTSALLLVNCWKLDTVQLMAVRKLGRFLLAEGHLGPALSASWQTLPKEALRSHFNSVLAGEGVSGNFSYCSRPGGFLNPVRKRVQGKDLC